jgi:hypothetical protein
MRAVYLDAIAPRALSKACTSYKRIAYFVEFLDCRCPSVDAAARRDT